MIGVSLADTDGWGGKIDNKTHFWYITMDVWVYEAIFNKCECVWSILYSIHVTFFCFVFSPINNLFLSFYVNIPWISIWYEFISAASDIKIWLLTSSCLLMRLLLLDFAIVLPSSSLCSAEFRRRFLRCSGSLFEFRHSSVAGPTLLREEVIGKQIFLSGVKKAMGRHGPISLFAAITAGGGCWWFISTNNKKTTLFSENRH